MKLHLGEVPFRLVKTHLQLVSLFTLSQDLLVLSVKVCTQLTGNSIVLLFLLMQLDLLKLVLLVLLSLVLLDSLSQGSHFRPERLPFYKQVSISFFNIIDVVLTT